MSNKMIKFFSMIYFLLITSLLLAYEFKQEDFINSYQYRLYKSWIRKGNFQTNTPAFFKKEAINKEYKVANNKINIVYYWRNRKIYNQIESVEGKINLKEEDLLKQHLHYIGAFIYRLNTVDEKYIKDYYNSKEVGLRYNSLKDSTALKKIMQLTNKQRLLVKNVKLKSTKEEIIFSLITNLEKKIDIIFPLAQDVAKILANIKQDESILRDFEKPLKDTKPVVVNKVKEKEPEVTEEQDSYKQSYLLKFLNENKEYQRELLHNKVKNTNKFLKRNFVSYEIEKNNDEYFIRIEPTNNGLYGDIAVKKKSAADGIKIEPLNDYTIEDKHYCLRSGEKIELTALSDEEIERISPYLSHLLFEHRALGTELLNFLLIHDNVPSTLVVHEDRREIFDYNSYANLLLLMNEYWKNRRIYFSIKKVMRVNGMIEFKGFLIAKSNAMEASDVAEIRIQLNREYKINYVMMIIHSNTDNS